jgi:predicted esterase
MSAPSLTRHDGPHPARGLVLMLHGGRADGLDEVEETSASFRRSRWMMRTVAPRLGRDGVAVWLLRYGVRGWNAGPGDVPSPVPDARWALAQVRRELPEVPIVLLGHSMGGRTAVAVADEPGVVGVVALAPWLPPGESHLALAGKHLAVAHGRGDRITSLRDSRAFSQGAQAVAAGVELRDMGRVGHYMLRRVGDWNAFAVSRSLRQLGAVR